MKKIHIALLLSIVTFGKINAQELTENNVEKGKRYAFFVGYSAYKLSNPGFHIGVEKYLSNTQNYEVIGALKLNFFTQKDVQTGLSFHANFGQRYKTNFGLFLESFIGIGVQQSFFTSQSFEFTQNTANVVETKASKTGLSPSLILGIGYDFEKVTKHPLKLYVRPSFYWLYPDRNVLISTNYSIETGFIFRPNWGKR